MIWDKSLIGIDIGSSSIKVCELSHSNKSLKRVFLEELPSPLVVDGEIRDHETIRTILLEMFKKNKISTKGRRASIAVGGSSVLIKRALISPDPQTDLEEQAFYEAKQLFQHDLDEMFVRSSKVGAPISDGRIPYLIVGARKELVEQNIGLIKSIGLKTGVVDCTPLAIANAFEHNYPVANQLIIIANIGASSTQIVITFDGEFLYTREINLGGMDYNRAIMSNLGVDIDNSEVLKISASQGVGEHEEQILESISSVNEKITSEISTTIDYFLENDEYPESMQQNGYVFLMGGASKTVGLDGTIAANIKMPVQFINPFHRVNFISSKYKPEYIMNYGCMYGVSLGLALRHFQDHN